MAFLLGVGVALASLSAGLIKVVVRARRLSSGICCDPLTEAQSALAGGRRLRRDPNDAVVSPLRRPEAPARE